MINITGKIKINLINLSSNTKKYFFFFFKAAIQSQLQISSMQNKGTLTFEKKIKARSSVWQQILHHHHYSILSLYIHSSLNSILHIEQTRLSFAWDFTAV